MTIKKTPPQFISSEQGVSALELMVIIVALLAALTVAVPLLLNRSADDRENITRKKLQTIKTAIIGDPHPAVNGSRNHFGFFGDLGVLPDPATDPVYPLYDLLENVGNKYPAYALVSNLRFGWRGPYLERSSYINGGNTIYTAFHDAWNTPFLYLLNLDGDSTTLDAQIRSAGANRTFELPPLANIDDLFVDISDEDVRTYVSGTFRDQNHNPAEESKVTVYFPNGTAVPDSVEITPLLNKTQYDSQTDPVSDVNKRKIPIGSRYFETQDHGLKRIVALNSGSQSLVRFVIEQILSTSAALYELTFRPSDDTAANQIRDVYMPWFQEKEIILPNYDRHGYLTFSSLISQGYPLVPAMIEFGEDNWDDYRVEANILHGDGYKYQLFYRTTNLNFDPIAVDPDYQFTGDGYGFEFDPASTTGGDYASGTDNGAGIGSVTIRLWKYRTLMPRLLLDQKTYTKAQFQTAFGYWIIWRAHQISVTVETVNPTAVRHYVLINGRQAFNTSFIDDNSAGFLGKGQAGLIADSITHIRLHHILVHKIPQQPDLPFVWWSFEEGWYGGNFNVYGYGYLNNAPVLIGRLTNTAHITRKWLDTLGQENGNKHGQTIYSDGDVSARIEFDDIMDFSPDEAFSFSLWFKLPTINIAREYTLISKIKQGNESGWKIILKNVAGHGFSAAFNMRQNNPNEIERINTTDVVAGKWYHLAIVYDGTPYIGGNVADNALQIYLTSEDDAAAAASPGMHTVKNNMAASANTVHNEIMIMAANRNGSNTFAGYFDEIKIFHKALTQQEVNDLFQKDK